MEHIQSSAVEELREAPAGAAEQGSQEVHEENRKYKDSLFVDLFYQDEKAGENLLSLYNALYGTELTDPKLIRRLRIDDVLYKNFKNDISFEVGGKLFVFGEHQSTLNQNMPLRCLMYAGRVYEQLVSIEARYKEKLVRIPTPEFLVFYNGTKDAPAEEELRLSSAFMVPQRESFLELTVRVININTDKGHELLEKCSVLREYSQFVDTVRRYQREKAAEPVKEAIQECIKNGILAEYLRRKGSEVVNMLIAEYDYEMDIRVKQEEAREEGRQEGELKGRQEGELKGRREELISTFRKMWRKEKSASEIADTMDKPLEFVEEVLAVFRSHPEWDEEKIAEEITWAADVKGTAAADPDFSGSGE